MEFKPRRLSHCVPKWVENGAVYHIRIRTLNNWNGRLTDNNLGTTLLDSAAFYHGKSIWNCRIFLLMPDHLHALLSFAPNLKMTDTIRNWKRFHAKKGVEWQDDFFDHRIRNENELDEKTHYIRMNPVVKGLCERPEQWNWVLEGDSRL